MTKQIEIIYEYPREEKFRKLGTAYVWVKSDLQNNNQFLKADILHFNGNHDIVIYNHKKGELHKIDVDDYSEMIKLINMSHIQSM